MTTTVILVALCVILLVAVVWLCVDGRDARRRERMSQTEWRNGFRGQWVNNGDGTLVYVVDGEPIWETQERMP